MTKRQLQRRVRASRRRSMRKWRRMDTAERATIVAGAVIHVTLMTLAQVDLGRRPEEQIRGPRWLWRLIVLVNLVGPVAYFAFGRRRRLEEPVPAEQPAATIVA